VSTLIKIKPAIVTYKDGIYVVYRSYETFRIKPAYEFGYGLSYTSFAYNNLRLSSAWFTGKITVSVDVKNNGSVAGREVSELYLSAQRKKLLN
jgi:beta-glucosidase